MFDISWSEILMVIIVAIFVLKPEDIPHIFKFFRKINQKIKQTKNEFNQIYKNIEEDIDDINDKINYISNESGEEFISYDVSEIIEFDSRKKKKDE